jgi:HEAT repeat protein
VDIGTLLRQVYGSDACVKESAVVGLGEVKDSRAVSALIMLLDDPSPTVRSRACSSLVALGALAVPSLLQTLQFGNPEPRRQAALALGALKEPRAVDLLLALLTNRQASLRAAGAEALGNLRATKALDSLIAELRDDDPLVRWWAVWALGMLKDQRALDYLVACLQKADDPVMGIRAAEALGNLGGNTAESALLALLKHQDPALRAAAIAGLGRMHSKATARVIDALEDPAPEVRVAAVDFLGDCKEASALPALARGLGDKALEVRAATARALGATGDTRVLPGLKIAAQDGQQAVRLAAIDGMERMGAPALDLLAECLGRSPVSLRCAAALALGRLKNSQAVAPLLQALRDRDPLMRLAVARALSDIGTAEATTPLLPALQANAPEVVAGAYAVFIRTGQAGSENALTTALNQYGTAEMAAAFTRSGNAVLERFARDWATAHQIILPAPTPDTPKWGVMK